MIFKTNGDKNIIFNEIIDHIGTSTINLTRIVK